METKHEKLGIGLVGGQGRAPAVGMFFNLSGRAIVRAVADLNPAAFEVGRNRFEAGGASPDLYTDVGEMLERDDLDWIVVGTPDSTHAVLARQVIEAGRNVFVEKPMAQDLADADSLCDLVEEGQARLVVGLELRFSPFVMAFRKALREGKVGRPVAGVYIDHGAPGYTFFLRCHRKKPGLLMQKGIHSLDMMNDFAGSDPVRVYGVGGLDFFGGRPEAAGLYCRDCDKKESCPYSFSTVRSETWVKTGPRKKGEGAFDHCVFMPDSDAEDNMHLTVEYANGFRFAYTAVYFAPRYTREVMVWGTEGMLHGTTSHGKDEISFTPFVGRMSDPESENIPTDQAEGSHGGGDMRMVEAICDATCTGEPIRPDVWDGRASVALAEAALKTIEDRQPVDIPIRRSY